VARRFDRVGFEPIVIRRLILPAKRYVEGDAVLEGQPGISRQWLAGRHRGIGEEDLRTAAAHYLYRKPVTSA
jgi:hypothetical protein